MMTPPGHARNWPASSRSTGEVSGFEADLPGRVLVGRITPCDASIAGEKSAMNDPSMRSVRQLVPSCQRSFEESFVASGAGLFTGAGPPGWGGPAQANAGNEAAITNKAFSSRSCPFHRYPL